MAIVAVSGLTLSRLAVRGQSSARHGLTTGARPAEDGATTQPRPPWQNATTPPTGDTSISCPTWRAAAAVIRRGHARRHRPAQPFREHGVPDRGPARRIQGRDADSPSELPDAQRHPDRAGLDARAEQAGIGTPQALPALDGTVLQRVTRAGGHALCSAVPLDRRRFSRSGQAGRLAAPPGLAQRPHARAVAAPGGVPAISSAWSGTTPARWARPRMGTVGTRAGPDARHSARPCASPSDCWVNGSMPSARGRSASA